MTWRSMLQRSMAQRGMAQRSMAQRGGQPGVCKCKKLQGFLMSKPARMLAGEVMGVDDRRGAVSRWVMKALERERERQREVSLVRCL